MFLQPFTSMNLFSKAGNSRFGCTESGNGTRVFCETYMCRPFPGQILFIIFGGYAFKVIGDSARKFFLAGLLFILQTIATAQTSRQIQITGKTETHEGFPVEFVTVSLFRSDSVFISSTISDSLGKFSIAVPAEGILYLKYSHIGFEDTFIVVDIPHIIARGNDLGVIKMKKDVSVLTGVNVMGKKKIIERKIDRIIFNVSQSISAGSSSFLEILNKTPGVRADNNGGVSVAGKSSIILIDGKQVQLGGDDLADLLKGKQADIIDRIEVYANPPAKFDAQGASVINIITRRRKSQGYDGTFRGTYKQGYNARYGLGSLINYSNKSFRFSANYSYTPSVFRTVEDEYVDYNFASGAASFWDMQHFRKVKAWSHDISFSAEYSAGKKHTFGFQTDGFLKGNTNNRTIRTIITNETGSIDSSLNTINRNYPRRNQGNFNFNYKFVTDTAGGSLNADININRYRAKTRQEIHTDSYDAFQTLKPDPFEAKSNSIQEIRVKSFKIDWIKPVNSKIQFEAGIKLAHSETDNDILFMLRQPGGFVTDPGRTNTFLYTEETRAAYTNYSQNFGKVGVQAGLRAEYTTTRGNSKTTGSEIRNEYFRIFPSLYLQYDMVADKHQLTLSFGKRIRRPDYWRLNPFQFYTTPYSYLQGNPFLQPSFNYSSDITYTFKNTYSITVYYNYTDKPFTNITAQDNITGILVNNQVNLKNNSDFGVYISLPLEIRKWWETNLFIQGSRKYEKTVFDGNPVVLKNWFGYANCSNTFQVSQKKNIKAEVSFWYASPGIQGIYHLKSSNDLSLSLRKGFSKNKVQLTLGVQDILYGNIYRIYVDYKDQKNGFTEKNDSRMFTLNFVYRFSKNTTTRARQRKTGGEEEKARLGNL
jgi:hypothetical protein